MRATLAFNGLDSLNFQMKFGDDLSNIHFQRHQRYKLKHCSFFSVTLSFQLNNLRLNILVLRSIFSTLIITFMDLQRNKTIEFCEF